MRVFGPLVSNGSAGRRRLRCNIDILKVRRIGDADFFGGLTLVLLLIGAGLRVWQYAIGEALWYDELALARNLVETSFYDLLTTPLKYGQVAPAGFLLVEKAAITAFGNNEYALRLFPLLCSLASLPLFVGVARRILAPEATLLAVTLFNLSPRLIAFASQAKQYSTDVAITLLLTALTLRWRQQRPLSRAYPSAALLGAVGLVVVWFSHAAVLVLAGLGVALIIDAHFRKRHSYREIAPITSLWFIGIVSAVIFAVYNMSPSTLAYMQAYWSNGFMPLPPEATGEALWLWRAFRGLFQREFRYPLPGAGVLLMLLGTVSLVRFRRWPALVILAPLGIALFASAARHYPFGERVSLFLLPAILLLAVEGVYRLQHVAATLWRPFGLIVLIMATAVPVYALYTDHSIQPKREIREVLAYVDALRRPDDAIYIFHNAWHSVRYYGVRYGLPREAMVIGHCPAGDSRKLLTELDQFRGQPRLWVIISHAVGPFRERETILSYLAAIGLERQKIVTGTGRLSSSAYLFDLSDPERLRAVSARTHILPTRENGIPEFPCPPTS